MAHCFTKVSEEEIEEASFYPSDLVNTETTIPLRAGEEGCICTLTLRVLVYICCSSIFTLEQFVFELVQNSLNWYNFV